MNPRMGNEGGGYCCSSGDGYFGEGTGIAVRVGWDDISQEGWRN